MEEVLIPQPHLYSYRRLGDSRVAVNFTLEVSPVKFHGCLVGGEADAGKKEALQASDSMTCGAPWDYYYSRPVLLFSIGLF